jgi:hypothetical protein
VQSAEGEDVLSLSRDLAYTTTPLDPGPLDMHLERITLQPGATIERESETGLRYFAVENGQIEVTWAKQEAPGVASGNPFVAEAPAYVEANGDRYYAMQIANRTSEPVVVLYLSVSLSGASESTPTSD